MRSSCRAFVLLALAVLSPRTMSAAHSLAGSARIAIEVRPSSRIPRAMRRNWWRRFNQAAVCAMAAFRLITLLRVVYSTHPTTPETFNDSFAAARSGGGRSPRWRGSRAGLRHHEKCRLLVSSQDDLSCLPRSAGAARGSETQTVDANGLPAARGRLMVTR
jgi:hypothetical protein